MRLSSSLATSHSRLLCAPNGFRPQYAMIEQDVKQALPLLEMSLSGLLSAENALKRWKEQLPSKVMVVGSRVRGA